MTEYALWSRREQRYANTGEGVWEIWEPWYTTDVVQLIGFIARTPGIPSFQWELRTREDVEQAEQIPF